jgi:hypothetical protein
MFNIVAGFFRTGINLFHIDIDGTSYKHCFTFVRLYLDCVYGREHLHHVGGHGITNAVLQQENNNNWHDF